MFVFYEHITRGQFLYSFIIAMNSILLMSFMLHFPHRNSHLLHSTDTNHFEIEFVLRMKRYEMHLISREREKLFNQKRFLAFINQITCCNLFYVVFHSLLFLSSFLARLIFICRPQHSFFLLTASIFLFHARQQKWQQMSFRIFVLAIIVLLYLTL